MSSKVMKAALPLLCAALMGQTATPPATTPAGDPAPVTSGPFGLPGYGPLNIRDFGATGDGTTMDTAAIQQAIDRCWALGGGEVLVPPGNYLTGSIALRSNVTLRLDKEATITGSPDLADYRVTQVRWEGKWIEGHLGLIYALDSHNIAIVGPGHIIGNRAVAGRPNPRSANPDDRLRHPALIEPINCDNVRFEDFSTQYTTMWCIHPTYCEHVLAKNLTIRSSGGNGDGIDIDSCKHVVVDTCDIATGDDAIAIKSGRGMEGYKLLRTTEDVEVKNCTLADSIFAGLGIGSETSGGVRNVRVEHCKFVGAKTFAVYIKTNIGRGAFIEDISVNDCEITNATQGFVRIEMLGSGLQDEVPVRGMEGAVSTKNFKFTNIRLVDCPLIIDAANTAPEKPLDGLVLSNITGTVQNVARGKTNLPMSLAYIKNAEISNIKVTGFTGPLLGTYQVTGKGLEGASEAPKPKVVPLLPEHGPIPPRNPGGRGAGGPGGPGGGPNAGAASQPM